MEDKKIILDVKNLNTSFKSDGQVIKIIKDVSFHLEKGRSLAIVGESGCGKSVTVHSVTRLMAKNAIINSDHVIYRSYRNSEEPKEYRIDKMSNYGKEMRSLRGPEISMVFQDPMASLNPVYRVGDQIIEGLLEHNKSMSKKEAMEKAIDMLKKLGIPAPEQRVKDYPYQLSGGMKQRIVIAIAMINDPELIIADEPTTALDVTIQAQIMELMKKLQTDYNKSIILITHNMGLVTEMADDVIVMYMGRIVEKGSLRQIFSNPSHPYTKMLLSSVPVLGLEQGQKLTTIPGSTPNPADLKEGCEFAGRCPFCTDACLKGKIPGFEIEEGHMVRCLRCAGHKEVD